MSPGIILSWEISITKHRAIRPEMAEAPSGKQAEWFLPDALAIFGSSWSAFNRVITPACLSGFHPHATYQKSRVISPKLQAQSQTKQHYRSIVQHFVIIEFTSHP